MNSDTKTDTLSTKQNLDAQWAQTTQHTPLEASESTFHNNIPCNVKKAHKATDLCEHCEKYDNIIREQKRIKLAPDNTASERQYHNERRYARINKTPNPKGEHNHNQKEKKGEINIKILIKTFTH